MSFICGRAGSNSWTCTAAQLGSCHVRPQCVCFEQSHVDVAVSLPCQPIFIILSVVLLEVPPLLKQQFGSHHKSDVLTSDLRSGGCAFGNQFSYSVVCGDVQLW